MSDPPPKRDGEQTDHTVELQLGGAQQPAPRRRKRTPRLRVISPLQLPEDWEVRSLREPDAPRTREECRGTQRPCPYVACRHHNWLRLQQEQPGNPQAGKQGETTFRASTLQSCSLDVAESGGVSYEEIGDHLGMDSTRARQIAHAALAKLSNAQPALAKLEGFDWAELLEAQ